MILVQVPTVVFVCRDPMKGDRKCCSSPLTVNPPHFDGHHSLVKMARCSCVIFAIYSLSLLHPL
jgi:hypothetical protein